MQATRRGVPVGLFKIVCALIALGLLGATVTWEMNFSGLVALIIVIVLYAVFRDARMLWHAEKPVKHAVAQGASTYAQAGHGANERDRTAIE